jgi:uncharacterized protein
MTLLLGLFGIFVAGIMSGLLGVGGGLLMVPIFTLLLGKPMPISVATSLAIIVPTAIAGALFHWSAGRVDMRLFLMGAVFAVLGGLLGAWLSGSVSPTLLRRIFAVVLLVVAVRMFFQS